MNRPGVKLFLFWGFIMLALFMQGAHAQGGNDTDGDGSSKLFDPHVELVSFNTTNTCSGKKFLLDGKDNVSVVYDVFADVQLVSIPKDQSPQFHWGVETSCVVDLKTCKMAAATFCSCVHIAPGQARIVYFNHDVSMSMSNSTIKVIWQYKGLSKPVYIEHRLPLVKSACEEKKKEKTTRSASRNKAKEVAICSWYLISLCGVILALKSYYTL